MTYQYTIIQENSIDKTKMTYEFSADDDTHFLSEVEVFMRSIGLLDDGYLDIIQDNIEDDDVDSEAEATFGSASDDNRVPHPDFPFIPDDDQRIDLDYTFDTSDDVPAYNQIDSGASETNLINLYDTTGNVEHALYGL